MKALAIGPRLKSARSRRGLSLRALGERTGFSASFLSQVELGQTSPSLASLGRITDALGISLSALLADPQDEGSPVVRRREPGLESEWSKANVRALLPAGVEEPMGAVLITLEPGGQSGKTPAATGGHELAYCIRGALELELDGERMALEEGDSAYYATSRQVQWRNVGPEQAELILVSVRRS